MKDLTQQTFQTCFNVVFCLMRRRHEGQRQINIETMLCISTLEFTMLNNVESTSNNVRQGRNNNIFFNVEFQNVGKSGNNVVKMTIIKKNTKKSFKIEYTEFKFLTTISCSSSL